SCACWSPPRCLQQYLAGWPTGLRHDSSHVLCISAIGMSVFLAKRLLTFLATLLVASALVFSVLELLPGNVAQVILGDTATPESIAALEKKLGLDRPAAERYTHWISGLLQGRTADSFSYGTPTVELIVERLR